MNRERTEEGVRFAYQEFRRWKKHAWNARNHPVQDYVQKDWRLAILIVN